MAVLFEWDKTKDEANRAKHGLSFAAIEDFDWDDAVLFDRSREEDGEVRHAATGPLYGKLHTVVFTKRGVYTRLISLRRANKREERAHEENRPPRR